MTSRAEERAEIVRILSQEPFLCWDCRTSAFKVSGEHRRPVVELFHLLTCPAYARSAWSARACEDYVRACLIMGGLHLADYGESGLPRLTGNGQFRIYVRLSSMSPGTSAGTWTPDS